MAAREEFETQYAARSGVTVDYLHGCMLCAVPCDCGESGCEGWQMAKVGMDLRDIHLPAGFTLKRVWPHEPDHDGHVIRILDV